jgi:glycerol-1-phosphate dehydrogenase [NAD(P)+]
MHPNPLKINSTALHGEKVGVGTIIMSELYHHFIACNTTNTIRYLFTPVTREKVLPYFGDLTDGILKENESDCLLSLDPGNLLDRWDRVCQEINSIPKPHILYNIYESLGLKSSLKDIGVEVEKKDQLIFLCPLVRNRLTLARIIRQTLN